MNIGSYIMAPSVRQAVPPPPQPTAQVVLNPALLVAQTAVFQTRTQTTAALQAIGNAEQTKTGQTNKETGESIDTQTNTVSVRSKGGGRAARGTRVNIRV